MSFWRPKEATQKNVKFWLECIQTLSIPIAIIGVGATYWWNADARLRELRKPYDEKQLALYVEAARVVAHLAAAPDEERTKTEARFWELYWGELALVESRHEIMADGQLKPSIESAMRAFCDKVFGGSKCIGEGNNIVHAAIGLAHQASDEIQERWNKKPPKRK